MSDAVEFVKNEILKCFADAKADVGHVLNSRVFYHQHIMRWNPKQKAALDSALEQMEAEGVIEQKEGNAILTQKGFDTLY